MAERMALERSEHLLAQVAKGIQEEIKRESGRSASSILAKVSSFLTRAIVATLPALPGGTPVAALVNAAQKEKEVQGDIDEIASIASTRVAFEELVAFLLTGTPLITGTPSTRGQNNSQHKRLIVLIDDLDRALPDQILTILKNLKLILEVDRCIFLLGMDMQVVARSVESSYRRHVTLPFPPVASETKVAPNLDQSLVDTGFGMNFLEKLVQVRIPVPQLTRGGAFQYVRELGFADEIVQIVSWAPTKDITNPRRLKRYLNWLSVALQVIMATTLPEDVDNTFALRALALRRAYLNLYSQLFKQISPLSIEWPEAVGDPAFQKGFYDFIMASRLWGDTLDRFERFLSGSILLGFASNEAREWGLDDRTGARMREEVSANTYLSAMRAPQALSQPIRFSGGFAPQALSQPIRFGGGL